MTGINDLGEPLSNDLREAFRNVNRTGFGNTTVGPKNPQQVEAPATAVLGGSRK
jgi:hypothetical protein